MKTVSKTVEDVRKTFVEAHEKIVEETSRVTGVEREKVEKAVRWIETTPAIVLSPVGWFGAGVVTSALESTIEVVSKEVQKVGEQIYNTVSSAVQSVSSAVQSFVETISGWWPW